MIVGTEWLIEAANCDTEKLRDERVLREIFDRIIEDLGLKVIDTSWHKFAGEGGVTGMAMLTESHLTCHTYPEHRTATFNLYCCRTRPVWNWDSALRSNLKAKTVSVRAIVRGSADENSESEIPNSKIRTAGGEV